MQKKYIWTIISCLALIITMIYLEIKTNNISNLFQNSHRDFVVAYIGFIGAIVGGAITLLGVRSTIKHTEKMKRKEYLPTRINHLENAMDFLDYLLEERLPVLINRDGNINNTRLVVRSNHFFISFTDEYSYLTGEAIKNLRSELVYAGSEPYEKLMKVRKGLKSVRRAFGFPTAELITIANRLGSKHDVYDNQYYDINDLSQEQRDELNRLTSEIFELDQKALNNIFREFNNLYNYLEELRDNLMEDIY